MRRRRRELSMQEEQVGMEEEGRGRGWRRIEGDTLR